ncbi:DNA repair protein RecN [Imtechella halotolerans]|uniref:DNA repair protein RecN n=1 Tax=Imtechella halotolerans K1 TaxID=946077 RepID=I0WFR7_9FLAO|nr:DNA repair protein RecN [Imtechella halotolerans]EID75233.1 DNA repair protein RecN [Imtechella halotolerans K1]WMQ63871.1 DNA repair protein RecN [Imtechella halotolerans]
MLQSLSIKNFALIEDIKVRFSEGFLVITGETGAGKSILLDALSLVLGKRADLNSLKNKEEKCVIEAVFDIEHYGLAPFFAAEDIDFDASTIIRREILPSGKSRAFINDTPVTLDVMSSLGEQLVDVHSQHQTLQLGDTAFQFGFIDAVAGNTLVLEKYTSAYKELQKARAVLKSTVDSQAEAQKEYDYNLFLLKELKEAKLQAGVQEQLEEVHEKLSNIETIQERLAAGIQLFSEESVGVLSSLSELKSTFQKLTSYGKVFQELSDRLQSLFIEAEDIHQELQMQVQGLESDPGQLEQVSARLQRIYDLQKKHQVATVEELLTIEKALEVKVGVVENAEEFIKEQQKEVEKASEFTDKIAEQIRANRLKVIPKLKKQLETMLAELGMPNAQFQIEVAPSEVYFANGKDSLVFLFSANKGTAFGELKKVASGGELSRIMLVIKAIMAEHMSLPTIMFDEIDTGVSGEIASKMAAIMKEMSASRQVFSITHLPQVASKGGHHYKVFKEEVSGVTATQLTLLSKEERIVEIAQMLGGNLVTESALAHAKELLA